MKKEVLFNLIKQKQNVPDAKKYLLFLGAGVSLTSGASLFSKIFESIGTNNYDEFSTIFSSLSDNERYTLLHEHINISSPSKAAQELAKLIKEGYFSLIITTNFDNLLEKCLQSQGLTTEDFEVIVNNPKNPIINLDQILSYTKPRIKILKLHGDFLKRCYAITKDETKNFNLLLLKLNDCLIIGSKFSDLDLIESLSDHGSSLWYINPDAPFGAIKEIMEKRGCGQNQVCGSEGKFDSFIKELTTSLQGINQAKYQLHWNIICPFMIYSPPFKFHTSSSYTCSTNNSRTILNFDNGYSLHWFNDGRCVWNVEQTFSALNIYEYALERRKAYKDILSGKHPIAIITKEISKACKNKNASEIGYCLSLVEVQKVAWYDNQINNAFKLFSSPSILYEKFSDDDFNNFIESDIEKDEQLLYTEIDYLRKGLSFEDFENFSINNTIKGYASWSGVAYQILNEKKSISRNRIVDFEIKVQSFWWALNHLKELLFDSKDQFVIDFVNKEKLFRQIQKLLSIGPVENTNVILYKEAIIKSSRIHHKYSELKELL